MENFSPEDGADEWADLSGPIERKYFDEPQLNRSPHYRGRLLQLPEDEVRKLFVEMFRYFEVGGFDGMPFPPAGLPGTIHDKFSYDDPECELVAIGWAYFEAAVRSQSRTMHNRWKAANALIHRLQKAAREDLINEQVRYKVERAMELSECRGDAPAQQVYFIAADSGPIKIGIANNPKDRCKSLQTSHHERLSILVTCPGGLEQERAYHQQFAAHRLHGEWFERHPDILAEIDRLTA